MPPDHAAVHAWTPCTPGEATPRPRCQVLSYQPEGGTPLPDPGDSYRQDQARLAKLSRAERFEELMDFPLRHVFKVIGTREGLSVEVRKTLADLGFEGVVFVERLSSKGRHLSLTFELAVETGSQLDTIYSALEQVKNIAYLF